MRLFHPLWVGEAGGRLKKKPPFKTERKDTLTLVPR